MSARRIDIDRLPRRRADGRFSKRGRYVVYNGKLQTIEDAKREQEEKSIVLREWLVAFHYKEAKKRVRHVDLIVTAKNAERATEIAFDALKDPPKKHKWVKFITWIHDRTVEIGPSSHKDGHVNWSRTL